MLSFGATADKVGPLLRGQWQIAEEQAELHGTKVSRGGWRLVGPMHLAPTEEQARREVAYGIAGWADYMSNVTPLKIVPPGVTGANDIADALVGSGFAVIGTPDQAIARIRQLIDSTGGFGTFLLWTHDWADREATFRSMELFKRHVAPAFDRHTASLRAAEELSRDRSAAATAVVTAARAKASQDYEKRAPTRPPVA
jgi:limonene 1,2-monooxygenase